MIPLGYHPAPFPSPALTGAIDHLVAGRPVVIVGASDAGSAVVMPAGAADGPWINFTAREARGLVGMATPPRRAAALGLACRPRRHLNQAVPYYTMSIEAASGAATGISAQESAVTIRAAALGLPLVTAEEALATGPRTRPLMARAPF